MPEDLSVVGSTEYKSQPVSLSHFAGAAGRTNEIAVSFVTLSCVYVLDCSYTRHSYLSSLFSTCQLHLKKALA